MQFYDILIWNTLFMAMKQYNYKWKLFENTKGKLKQNKFSIKEFVFILNEINIEIYDLTNKKNLPCVEIINVF